MKGKKAQLFLNQHYSEIKHWLMITVMFILVVFALLSYATQNRLLDRVEILANQNKALSQQNKKLNEATKDTGEATQAVTLQNRAYTRCLAKIFAQYTHDFVPITIQNLDTCTIKTDTSGNTLSKTSNSSVSHSDPSPNHSTVTPTPQSNTSQPDPTPAPQPNVIQRLVGGTLNTVKGLLN